MEMIIVQILLVVLFCCSESVSATFDSNKFLRLRDTGNYTCDELTRWIGTEKHFSNDKKDVLFGFLASKDCSSEPVIILKDTSFGFSSAGKRTFFENPAKSKKHMDCTSHDEKAVAFLSNFSLNNNFSHFLHGLLRLFCALLDAKWIVWDVTTQRFIQKEKYAIWVDEYFKMTPAKATWLNAMGGKIRPLKDIHKGSCVGSTQLLYGSGCVKLLPPEKWFGYPGCRAGSILPAFGMYIRQAFSALGPQDLVFVDEPSLTVANPDGMRVAFAVRAVGDLTGKREISNLHHLQELLKTAKHVRSSFENVTFENLDVASTVRYMAGVHIFVSVHGAGMTNMFFMNPGSAVVEIIPHPLCTCKSPDFFYGEGGYYHGSAVAQDILHYSYCVPPEDTIWHEKPKDLKQGNNKCSWKHLHAVESVRLDTLRFVSLLRKVERDLIVKGTIELTSPIINMGAHANG